MVAQLVAAAARTAASQAAKKAATKAPRAKTAADERYNERRRAKRAADRLAKQAKQQSGAAREKTLQLEAQLRDVIKGSYKTEKGYQQSISDFRQSIQKGVEYEREQRSFLRPRSFAENQRLTNMRKAEFRKARLTDTQKSTRNAGGNPQLTSEQRLAQAEKDFFYSKTRELWIGGSEAMRDQNIVAKMQEYGLTFENGRQIENLEDAFQFIKEKNRQEIPTLENLDEFDVNEQETKSGSPRPISLKEWRSWRASVK